jgi:hypothetical protein
VGSIPISSTKFFPRISSHFSDSPQINHSIGKLVDAAAALLAVLRHKKILDRY